jgi:hypothetical protein
VTSVVIIILCCFQLKDFILDLICIPRFLFEPILDLSDLATVALLWRHFSPALDALVSAS